MYDTEVQQINANTSCRTQFKLLVSQSANHSPLLSEWVSQSVDSSSAVNQSVS